MDETLLFLQVIENVMAGENAGACIIGDDDTCFHTMAPYRTCSPAGPQVKQRKIVTPVAS
jgi:hypothetical protein